MSKRHFILILLILLIPVGCGASAPPQAPKSPEPDRAQAAARSPIGMNLSGIQAYTTAFPFVDVFKSSTPWVSGHGDVWNDERRINVDDHGWVKSLAPGQIVYSVFIDNTVGHFPAGQYTVTYDGEGEITYGEGARLVEHSIGRDIIEVDPSAGNCWLSITAVNPRNYIRNIRIRLPVEAPADEVFNPVFVERIQGFKVLRFLGWMLGDNPEQISQPNWSVRPKIDNARWSERGVPVEVMVELANRVGADPWFTIPHDADDDYVRRFAEIVRARLDPGLKVHVEHSNEVWNNTYTVFQYATDRGLTLKLSTEPYEARARYHVRRSRELWKIFEDTLGRARVVRVLAAQMDGPFEAEQMLAYEDTPKQIDVLALGAYFGGELALPENQARTSKMTLDELFREIESVSIPATMDYLRQNLEIARRYNVPVVAYEGGQHLSVVVAVTGASTGEINPEIDTLFDAAERDPRMGRMYTNLLQEWDAATNHALFVHLNECNGLGAYGRWGLLEYIEQRREEAPKYDAVMTWMEGK